MNWASLRANEWNSSPSPRSATPSRFGSETPASPCEKPKPLASASGLPRTADPACRPIMLTKTLTVALVGNPNAGKTTLFNALSGLRQRVGNYPGVTVETKKGQMAHHGQVFDLIDLPGTYSLAARSPDEMVAVDLVLGQQAGEPRPDV